MILCVDTTALKTSLDVQRDVNLEELLNEHTKFYPSEEEALKDKYVPLDFSVSVRSIYTNLVLVNNTENGKKYYTNLTKIEPFMHKGYDLMMYLTSIGLMHSIDYKLGFDELMMKHSQFMPIGLYNPDSDFINPIIYTHVIISDEGIKELPKYLKETSALEPISETRFTKGNIIALLETLVEVKEEHKDEQCDNN